MRSTPQAAHAVQAVTSGAGLIQSSASVSGSRQTNPMTQAPASV